MMKFEMKKGKFLRDSIIILGISLAILVVSEMILQISFPEKMIKDSNMRKSVAYEFNEDYLVSLKPSIIKEFVRSEENGGDITHWKTNSNSFRGSELEDNPRYRIIVYGDSNVQARFSENTRTLPVKLAHYLNKSAVPDVEVYKCGSCRFRLCFNPRNTIH